MYSGTTLSNVSGNLFGTHQKINRISRRKLMNLTSVKHFPSAKLLRHFEGKNGPDGIKSKSPGSHEPTHFFDPFDPEGSEIFKIIEDHYKNLVFELKTGDLERAAFEATWLSHALVDGLTPAHHYPYEEELANLRLGEGNETRKTIKQKLSAKGSTKKEAIENNWKLWGAKGLLITHGLFEGGVASITALMKYPKLNINKDDVDAVQDMGLVDFFKKYAREIALLNMYEEYYRTGWNVKLAREVRDDLVPRMIHIVTCAWYLALKEAGLVTRSGK